MIYGKLQNISQYMNIDRNFDTAIKFLQSNDLKTLQNGRNPVDGDDVFVNVFEYQTIPTDELSFEAHNQYADLHITISGEENLEVAHVSSLLEFERRDTDDYIGYQGDAEAILSLTTNHFVFVFPEDAHKVKVMKKEPSHVRKAVFKIKIN